MKNFPTALRQPQPQSNSKKILHSSLVLILGLLLGLLAKILDQTPSNHLPFFLEILDLRNFLSRMGFWLFCGLCLSIYSSSPWRAALNTLLFFSGMLTSYYAYTLFAAGFFPRSYILIWAGLTLFSPFIAFFCWYAKGNHPLSIFLSAILFAFLTRQTFAFGFWYLDLRYQLEGLLWLASLAVFYSSPAQLLKTVILGLFLFFLTAPFSFFWGLL